MHATFPSLPPAAQQCVATFLPSLRVPDPPAPWAYDVGECIARIEGFRARREAIERGHDWCRAALAVVRNVEPWNRVQHALYACSAFNVWTATQRELVAL